VYPLFSLYFILVWCLHCYGEAVGLDSRCTASGPVLTLHLIVRYCFEWRLNWKARTQNRSLQRPGFEHGFSQLGTQSTNIDLFGYPIFPLIDSWGAIPGHSDSNTISMIFSKKGKCTTIIFPGLILCFFRRWWDKLMLSNISSDFVSVTMKSSGMCINRQIWVNCRSKDCFTCSINSKITNQYIFVWNLPKEYKFKECLGTEI